ncbi:hypothetical protein ACGGZK_05660 [Agromyces sp. MMS24-K17]|uniref:hypothetical protein n=1 Tax=Agromyces sp. MMS24-K17 TaxID=3372850 RepID=UPI0037551F03
MSESTSAPGSTEPNRRGGARFWVLAIIIGLAVIVAGVLIYQASYSAFTAQTQTGSSTFSSGNVELSNDNEAESVFTATGLKPGASGSADVVVTYTGSLDATVRLYASSSTGDQTLADGLDLTITPKVDGAAQGTPFTGTLAEFQAITDWDSGILELPVSTGDQITYTVEYVVADTAEQGASADVTFVWEAQNT